MILDQMCLVRYQLDRNLRTLDIGIHFADASLWIACTSILQVYDIRPPTKNGQPVLPAVKFTSESIRWDVNPLFL